MTFTTSVPEANGSGTREIRALRLFEERGREIRRVAGEADVYLVPSCSRAKPDRYRVDYRAESCDCPDFTVPRRGREPGEPCKHVYAVGIHLAKRRAGSARARTSVCSGCGGRFPRRELFEVLDSLTYFEGDLLCRACLRGSDAEVL